MLPKSHNSQFTNNVARQAITIKMASESPSLSRASPGAHDNDPMLETKPAPANPVAPTTDASMLQSIQTNATTKSLEDFRTYDENTTPARVVQHYKDMRTHQTVEFYQRMEEKYSFQNGHCRKLMTIEEALEELENYVDASDPDLDLVRLFHSYYLMLFCLFACDELCINQNLLDYCQCNIVISLMLFFAEIFKFFNETAFFMLLLITSCTPSAEPLAPPTNCRRNPPR